MQRLLDALKSSSSKSPATWKRRVNGPQRRNRACEQTRFGVCVSLAKTSTVYGVTRTPS